MCIVEVTYITITNILEKTSANLIVHAYFSFCQLLG